MAEGKVFLQIRSINIMYPNVENMIVVPIRKRMEIIMCIHACPISQMNFDYTKNGGKKAFPANSKHQYRVSQCGERVCHANNKNNADYYEYPSLSHFTDELLIIRKMVKRKAFLANQKHQYHVS